MKHTKLLVVALLVALIACLAMTATADTCNHPYDKVQLIGTIPPGCETKGISYYHCNACGANFEYTVDPLGHDFPATPNVTKQASCGEDGYASYTCQRAGCGHVKKITIPKSGNHTFNATKNDGVAATCVAPGLAKTVICSVCGTAKGPQETIAPLGHDFTNVVWVPETASTCQTHGKLSRTCTRANCNYKEYMEAPLVDHKKGDNPVLPGRAATCTVNGCKDIYECIWCGKQIGGESIPATGHDFNGVAWVVKDGADCVTQGILQRQCKNAGCTAKEYQNVGYGNHPDVFLNSDASCMILPAKAATCETTGCKAVYQCPLCGKTKGGTEVAALGHNITNWAWKSVAETASCTKDGVWHGTCSRAGCSGIDQKVPAYGHSAVWQIKEAATPTQNGISVLHCTRCGQDIATQVVVYGSKYPEGTVNTGSAANTAKASSTKTTTTKKTSTAKTTTTTTAAAPAAATTKTATVVAAAAPAALPTNAAALKADTSLYIVKNVADEDIVLSVEVKDGKITVTADLAEGESLVLYANEDAIANPTAENTLVLTANEAVELPAEFANAILAVVKTESLPAAVAAK